MILFLRLTAVFRHTSAPYLRMLVLAGHLGLPKVVSLFSSLGNFLMLLESLVVSRSCFEMNGCKFMYLVSESSEKSLASRSLHAYGLLENCVTNLVGGD